VSSFFNRANVKIDLGIFKKENRVRTNNVSMVSTKSQKNVLVMKEKKLTTKEDESSKKEVYVLK
jgi:hypothetical protein